MNAAIRPPPLSRPPRTSGFAIWSLVLGILSLACCLSLVTGIPAVICGHKARARIRQSDATLTGHGLALAGLITGYLGTALGALALALLLIRTVSQHLEDREGFDDGSCVNNLRILDGAKQQWALENRKQAADVPAPADLEEYLREGFQAVRCPEGGTYSLNAVDQPPTCSVPGHSLPPQNPAPTN